MTEKPVLTRGLVRGNVDNELQKKTAEGVRRQAITIESRTVISHPQKQSSYASSVEKRGDDYKKRFIKTASGSAEDEGGSGSGKKPFSAQETKMVVKTDIKNNREEIVRRTPISTTSKTVLSQPNIKTGCSSPRGDIATIKKENEQKITHREEEKKPVQPKYEEYRKVQRNVSINTVPQTVISRPKTMKIPMTGTGNSALKDVKTMAQKNLNSRDDSGATTVSYAITGTAGMVKVVKTTQSASDTLIKKTSAPIKTGVKGVYQVGKGAVRVVRAVDSTVGMIKTGAIKLDKNTMAQLKNVAVHNIKTASMNIVSAVTKSIKKNTTKPIAVGAKVIKTGVVGAYKVGRGTVKVVRVVDSTVGMIKTGAIKLDKNTMVQLKNIAVHKTINSRVAKRVSNAVHGIKTTITTNVSNIKSGVKTAKTYVVKVGKGAVKTVGIARGIVNGTVKIKISKEDLLKLGKRTIPIIGKGLKTGGKAIGYTVKTGYVGVRKGGSFVARGAGKIGKGLNYAGDVFSNSNSFEAQTVGYGMKSIHYTVKGIRNIPKVARVGYRGVKTSVKTVYKGGKFVVKTGVGTYRYVKTGINVARKVGTKQALKIYSKRWEKSFRGTTVKLLRKAGGSVVNVAIELIKKLGAKIIVPLLVAVVGVGAVFIVLSGATSLIAYMLSPFLWLLDNGSEIDERDWLTNQITTSRTELIEEVKETYQDNLAVNNGNYEYVRFYNSIENIEVELTDTNIINNIYSVDEYLESIEPIFHSIMLSEFQLQASESDMKRVFGEIWDLLSVVTTEPLPTEYCNMTITNNPDGTYTITPVPDLDGVVHADIYVAEPCPHYEGVYFHTENENCTNPICECDYNYWNCLGHKSPYTYCGLDEHPQHTGACCSKTLHTSHTSTCVMRCGTCGEDLVNGSCPTALCWNLYNYWNCGGIHDHTNGFTNACNTIYCGGKEIHEHVDWVDANNEGCYNTTFHTGVNGTGILWEPCANSVKRFGCNGYFTCEGHRILKLTIELENFGELLKKYFVDEIEQLQALSNPTADEQARLNELLDNYELCLEYQKILASEYGVGGGTVISLDGVTLTELTEFACRFIGKPYIWGGEDPNIGADCSGFVQYVYSHFGISLPRVESQQVAYGTTIGSISEAQAGDLIFWSSDGTDSGVYHVAIYLGNNKLLHASNSAPYPDGGIKVSNVYGTIYKIKRIAN